MARVVLILLAAIFTTQTAAQESAADRLLETARQLKQGRSFPAAAHAYETAIPALRPSGNRSLLAHALLEYGQASLSTGNYAGALKAALESARIFHELKDPADETQADNVAGSSQLYNGDYTGAIGAFENALRLDQQRHDAQGEITRLSNIGNVYFFQGKYLDAQRSYEQALHRVEETASEPWNAGRRGLVLTNLAALYEQLGQNEKALEYYQRALSGAGNMQPSEHAQLLSNVGTLYRRLGDAVKALNTYRAAQELYSSEHLSDGEIHVLQNIGIARALDFHDLAGSVAAFTKALTLADASANRRESVLAHMFRGEALYRMGKRAEARHDLTAALTTAREIGAQEEQWTALYGIGRIERSEGNDAGALAGFRSAIAIIESVRSGLGSASLKAEFLANKRQVYDDAIDLTLRQPGISSAELFRMFEEARARNLQDALEGGKVQLAAIQAALRPGSMLLEYWMGAGRLGVMWITRENSGVAAKALGEVDAAFLSGVPRELQGATDRSWRRAAERAGRLLLDGVPMGRGITQLLIVPDGVLSQAPFEAISAGAGSILVEQFAIGYLPSAALLLRNPNRRGPLFPWQRRLIGFGDPVVNARGMLPDDEHWSRLPDSARELRSIGHIVPGVAEIHAGEDDRKSYLLNGALAGAPMLHFSTHAAIDFTDPNRSRILFTPEPGQHGSAYLFRSEVQALPLAGVDLVTLSACDTERGKLARGEGVQSFSRAFLAAGARSTVTTLWRVADGPAADFMRLFYEHLARGETKAESLRGAKLSFLRSATQLALPRYWAAFVLTGDGQAPIPPVLSWAWFIGPASAVLIVTFLFLRRHPHRLLRRRFRRHSRYRLRSSPSPSAPEAADR